MMRSERYRDGSGGRWGFALIDLPPWRRSERAAFTLIVIAILALLLALLSPSLQQARELAWKATCQGNLKAIGNYFTSYVSREDRRPYPVFTSVFQEEPTSQYHASWINLLWHEFIDPDDFPVLYWDPEIKETRGVFYCPAKARTERTWGWGVREPNQHSYQEHSYGAPMVSYRSDRTVIFAWFDVPYENAASWVKNQYHGPLWYEWITRPRPVTSWAPDTILHAECSREWSAYLRQGFTAANWQFARHFEGMNMLSADGSVQWRQRKDCHDAYLTIRDD